VSVLTCPYCGEPIDSFVDPGGGERQEYIEDCSVCCRPIQFRAVWREDWNEYQLVASAEDD
jgi:Cysteine-rich CPXCG